MIEQASKVKYEVHYGVKGWRDERWAEEGHAMQVGKWQSRGGMGYRYMLDADIGDGEEN